MLLWQPQKTNIGPYSEPTFLTVSNTELSHLYTQQSTGLLHLSHCHFTFSVSKAALSFYFYYYFFNICAITQSNTHCSLHASLPYLADSTTTTSKKCSCHSEFCILSPFLLPISYKVLSSPPLKSSFLNFLL